MSAYSDSIFEPAFSEPALVSTKKNIETEVEIEFFRPFSSLDQLQSSARSTQVGVKFICP
jgi:hypothetical protein